MSTPDEYEIEVSEEEKSLYKLNVEAQKISDQPKKHSFWEEYGEKIILAVGILLIAGISFQAGFLKGQKNEKEPISVKQAACTPCPKVEGNSSVNTNNIMQKSNQNVKETQQPNSEKQTCAFVASKNSNKYHLASCQWAERIKSENKICFSSKEEAENRGYQPAKCCIK